MREGRSRRRAEPGLMVDVTSKGSSWLWLVGAIAAPLALGALLRPIEDAVGVPTVTLALVVPVVVVAATGRWLPAVSAALSAAVVFDYLYTEPRGSLSIAHVSDAIATVVLLAVGLIVVEVSAWGRRQRDTA